VAPMHMLLRVEEKLHLELVVDASCSLELPPRLDELPIMEGETQHLHIASQKGRTNTPTYFDTAEWAALRTGRNDRKSRPQRPETHQHNQPQLLFPFNRD
jgi:hypothetical protein